jgi:outer membrane protein assembly factor BamA
LARLARLALTLGMLALGASPGRAQVPIDALTEVRRIRFAGADALGDRKLRALLQTKDRGSAYGLRVALGKIPFVPPPAHHAFAPLVLQQDVVRIRQSYAAAGYFLADVRYDVTRDDARNLLDVTFRIDEGRPLLLTAVHVFAHDTTAALPVPAGERKSWERLVRSIQRQRGKPLAIDNANEAQTRIRSWWRDRGHPLASVRLQAESDTARSQTALDYRVAPGPFARFGAVDVEGTRSLSVGTVRRLTPIDSGDVYSAAALERTRLSLRQLEIIRVVNVDVPALAAADTSDTPHGVAAGALGKAPLPVRVQITEGDGHVIGADLGYVTDGGVSAEGTWEHRDFSGGGRSLKLSTIAQTGWLALADNPDERYRLGLALRQPGFLFRPLAGVLAPFVEYRDDTQDRSTQYGFNASIVRQVSQFQSASLSYQLADRQIHEYRFGDLASGEIDLLTFLTQVAQGALDSLGSSVRSSTFTLSGITGTLDHAANPRLGIIVRPALQVTAPTAWSSTSFWRADVSGNAFLPLHRRVTLAARGAIGRLFPFGKSVPDPGEDPTNKFLQLRDVMFTAGGTGDVRGWENRLLGPKVPEVRFTTDADNVRTPHTDSYVPLGGLERLSFSVELQLPLPGLGPNFGAHLFLDGGRVRTEDHRFDLKQGEHGQEQVFYSTGAGVDMRTPVGPIKMGFGYKLNPSLTDLVDPATLLRAAADKLPVDDLPRDQSRRWQFYLAIGASY